MATACALIGHDTGQAGKVIGGLGTIRFQVLARWQSATLAPPPMSKRCHGLPMAMMLACSNINQHIREPAVAIASRRRGAFAAVRPIEVAQQFGSRNTSRDREDGQIAGAGLGSA